MCRSIKRLREGAVVVSDEEIEEAARQYVRKISGFSRPTERHREAFERAVAVAEGAPTVVAAELWKVGQLKPGDVVRFRPWSLETALKAERRLTEEQFLAIDADAQCEVEAAVAFAEAGTWEPVADLARDVHTGV